MASGPPRSERAQRSGERLARGRGASAGRAEPTRARGSRWPSATPAASSAAATRPSVLAGVADAVAGQHRRAAPRAGATRRPRDGRSRPARSGRPSPRRAARRAESVSSQYRKKASSRPPTCSSALAADQHAGAGDPLGRAGRLVGGGVADQLVGPGRARPEPVQEERLREGRAPAREAALAEGEAAVVLEDPRGGEAGAGIARRAPRRARRGRVGRHARVGVEQEHVRRAAARDRRGCSRRRSRRCAPRARAAASRPSIAARPCRRASALSTTVTRTPGMAASGSTQRAQRARAVVGDDRRRRRAAGERASFTPTTVERSAAGPA